MRNNGEPRNMDEVYFQVMLGTRGWNAGYGVRIEVWPSVVSGLLGGWVHGGVQGASIAYAV